ncbi:MAG: hypothetical protein WCF12_14635 [Propionicimonas sp.]
MPKPTPSGHENVGIVEAVGDAVTTVKRPAPMAPAGYSQCLSHQAWGG